MSDFLLGFLAGGSSGGLLGYSIRAFIERRLAIDAQYRDSRLRDARDLRERLQIFLGEPQSSFWQLESLFGQFTEQQADTALGKAAVIRDWVNGNASRFPRSRQGPMNRISAVAQQLARGDRHFMQSDRGPEIISGDWDALTAYAEELTEELHGN